MVREFSEEKRQEIFRLLDEIDQREWKSFMEWCGSRAEEFGDWPDKLAVSAYTRYVDEYHEKVLEINEMTRQQVNTVFENVAEIDARYAARMRECQEKIKGQIAIVRTMTEFMDSMADGKPNMALLSDGSVNKAVARAEGEKIKNKEINPPNHGREGNSESQIADATSLEEEIETGTINLPEVNNTSEISNEEMEILEKYVNENVLGEVLGWDLDAAKVNLDENFIEDMRALMLEYGLTDEKSIILFLITITHECDRGRSMSEYGGQEYFDEQSYCEEESGTGLIQLTSKESQMAFLKYITNTTSEKDIEDLLGGMTPAEYIAIYYPIESALWFWCIYDKKISFDSQGCTINYAIETYGDTADFYNMFVATQCAVNGSEFIPRGIGRFFRYWNKIGVSDDLYIQKIEEDNGEIREIPHKDGCIILYYSETEDGAVIEKYSYKPNGWVDRTEIYDDFMEYLTAESVNIN